jgi:hypothetical protein
MTKRSDSSEVPPDKHRRKPVPVELEDGGGAVVAAIYVVDGVNDGPDASALVVHIVTEGFRDVVRYEPPALGKRSERCEEGHSTPSPGTDVAAVRRVPALRCNVTSRAVFSTLDFVDARCMWCTLCLFARCTAPVRLSDLLRTTRSTDGLCVDAGLDGAADVLAGEAAWQSPFLAACRMQQSHSCSSVPGFVSSLIAPARVGAPLDVPRNHGCPGPAGLPPARGLRAILRSREPGPAPIPGPGDRRPPRPLGAGHREPEHVRAGCSGRLLAEPGQFRQSREWGSVPRLAGISKVALRKVGPEGLRLRQMTMTLTNVPVT